MKRGDVYWVNLNPTVGSEIQKVRPCVIISNNLANQFSEVIIVAPITSQKLEKIYPHEVLIKNIEKLSNSKIKINQIRAIDKKRLGRIITKLDSLTMNEVDRALVLHLGIKEV